MLVTFYCEALSRTSGLKNLTIPWPLLERFSRTNERINTNSFQTSPCRLCNSKSSWWVQVGGRKKASENGQDHCKHYGNRRPVQFMRINTARRTDSDWWGRHGRHSAEQGVQKSNKTEFMATGKSRSFLPPILFDISYWCQKLLTRKILMISILRVTIQTDSARHTTKCYLNL